MIGSRGCPVFCEFKRGFWCNPLAVVPTTTNVCSCTWVVTGETASRTPGRHPTPNPTRAPVSPGGNYSPPLVRHVGVEHPRHRDPRWRRLGRLPPAREPARAVTDHHRRPLRHRRGGDGCHRRDVGVPVTGEGSGAISTCPAQTGDEPYESRAKGTVGGATGGPQRPFRTATMTAPAVFARCVAGAPGHDPYAGRLADRDAGSHPQLGQIERRP